MRKSSFFFLCLIIEVGIKVILDFSYRSTARDSEKETEVVGNTGLVNLGYFINPLSLILIIILREYVFYE